MMFYKKYKTSCNEEVEKKRKNDESEKVEIYFDTGWLVIKRGQSNKLIKLEVFERAKVEYDAIELGWDVIRVSKGGITKTFDLEKFFAQYDK